MRLVWAGMLLMLAIFSCRNEIEENYISTDSFQIKGDLQINVVAAEPLIEAPIAIDWDDEGRLWVLEMPDYMPDIDGVEEHIPRGRILILEDKNHNGRMDNSTVFLDKLHQPRAIALLYGGLLYAEAPNLWFVPIEDDKPGKPQLVDSLYATGGNVEHQPNGLMLNIDNWIYNAKSNYRYRKIGDTWLKEPTAFRGQWGITHDQLGYIYSNDNSNGLYGDYVLPGTATSHPFYQSQAAVNKDILGNRMIYPTHSTVINRGYTGILDDEGKAQYMTSTCGPHVSSGDVGEGDVFICVPEGNIVKRVSLSYGDSTKATNVYKKAEFLTATDEAFRPVEVNTGADGNLYITDFHRGIIQHKTYMTAYLREKLIERGLDSIVGMGRIWRISPSVKGTVTTNGGLNIKELSSSSLVENLSNSNGEIRLKSQHELIIRNDNGVVDDLRKIVLNGTSPLERLHALYTLEGMQVDLAALLPNIENTNSPFLIAHIIKLATASENTAVLKLVIEKYRDTGNSRIDRQIAHGLGRLIGEYPNLCKEIYNSILTKYQEGKIMIDMVMSGLIGHEEGFSNLVDLSNSPNYQAAYKTLISNIQNNKIAPIHQPLIQGGSDAKTRGLELFGTHCGACHGAGGLGINGLAPALAGAAIVDSDIQHLTLTLLTGLQGPIHVNQTEQTYNAAMPGLIANTSISNDDLASIASYVSNAFSKNPQLIEESQVAAIRKLANTIEKMPTEAEILDIKISLD